MRRVPTGMIKELCLKPTLWWLISKATSEVCILEGYWCYELSSPCALFCYGFQACAAHRKKQCSLLIFIHLFFFTMKWFSSHSQQSLANMIWTWKRTWSRTYPKLSEVFCPCGRQRWKTSIILTAPNGIQTCTGANRPASFPGFRPLSCLSGPSNCML